MVQGVDPKSLKRMMRGIWEPGAGHALRAARLLGVSVDAVLSGLPGTCQSCGCFCHTKKT